MTAVGTTNFARQARSGISRQAKLRLIDELARRSSDVPPRELQKLLPSWRPSMFSYLRNRKDDEFGWERLLLAAERLGVPVEIRIGEAA
jgi:hypothetical protein